jgi:hypothetical protein
MVHLFLGSGTVRRYHFFMNNKHRKTLTSIFQKTTPAGLEWRDVASLIKGLGGEIIHGDGSRVRIDLKNESVNIHSRHPQKVLSGTQFGSSKHYWKGQETNHEHGDLQKLHSPN